MISSLGFIFFIKENDSCEYDICEEVGITITIEKSFISNSPNI